MITDQFLNNNDLTYAVRRTEDVEPLVEEIKARKAAGHVGSSDMKLAASFPMTVIENYLVMAGITFAEFLADTTHANRMMTDPDLRYFRVWEGRVV